MENKESNSKQKNLVSIVLTYYNGKKYILDQLNSILSQTHRNWQLIIIDDCSTDGSEEILKKFIAENKDRQIDYIRNENNLGLAKNFEKGLGLVKGEFVAVCDPDDVWFKDKLECQVEFLKKNEPVGMAYSDLIVVDENLMPMKKSFRMSYFSLFNNPRRNTFEKLLKENHITAPTIMFRSDLINKLVPFSRHGLQDHWIAILASACSQIGYLEKSTVYYRQHGGNMVGASKVSIFDLIFKKNQNFLKNHLEMKKNSLLYLNDLKNVTWLKENQREMIEDKIRKTKILVACLEEISANKSCSRNLKLLWKLRASREIVQIIYFCLKK